MANVIYTCYVCNITATMDLENGTSSFKCQNCNEDFKVSWINDIPLHIHADQNLLKEISDSYSEYIKYKTGNYGPVTEKKRLSFNERTKFHG